VFSGEPSLFPQEDWMSLLGQKSISAIMSIIMSVLLSKKENTFGAIMVYQNLGGHKA
jgi:hypothetical protein